MSETPMLEWGLSLINREYYDSELVVRTSSDGSTIMNRVEYELLGCRNNTYLEKCS